MKKKINYKLNVKPSPFDERDLNYHIGRFCSFEQELPEEFFVKKLEIRNQGMHGACFHGDMLVLTEGFNYVKIKDLRKGDYVFSHTGKLNKVLERTKRIWQGIAYKIKVYGLPDEIYVTPEHPFLTKDGWKETRELTTRDYLQIPLLNNIINDKTIYSFEKDPDFLWVLGLYLAEGNLDKNRVMFTLNINKVNFAERIKKTMNKYGASVKYHFKEKNNVLRVSLAGDKWVKIFKELGGEYCNKKRINNRLMFISPNLQLNIFNGWKDGDGHNGKNESITIVTTSFELVNQMQIILLRNKIRGNIQKRNKVENKLQAYVLEVNKKHRTGYFENNNYFSKIRSIEKIPYYSSGYVYNLEVENEHTYLVKSVAVHNCVGFGASRAHEIAYNALIKPKPVPPKDSETWFRGVAVTRGSNGDVFLHKKIYVLIDDTQEYWSDSSGRIAVKINNDIVAKGKVSIKFWIKGYKLAGYLIDFKANKDESRRIRFFRGESEKPEPRKPIKPKPEPKPEPEPEQKEEPEVIPDNVPDEILPKKQNWLDEIINKLISFIEKLFKKKEYPQVKLVGEEELLRFSPKWIYSKCKELDGKIIDNGTYPKRAMEVLHEYGCVLDKDLPYKEPIPEDLRLRKELEIKAAKYKNKSYHRLFTPQEVKVALYNGHSITIAVSSAQLLQGWKKEVFPKYKRMQRWAGHQMCVVGWDKEGVWIENSWDKHWGKNGYSKIPYDSEWWEKGVFDMWSERVI